MNVRNLVFVMMVLMPTTAVSQTWENGPSCSTNITNCRVVGEAIVPLIRASGFQCNSITKIRKWVFGRGFTVHCHNWAYKYEVEDRGGTWVVRFAG